MAAEKNGEFQSQTVPTMARGGGGVDSGQHASAALSPKQGP